jgi:putative SOS response-associated peptidase YedK
VEIGSQGKGREVTADLFAFLTCEPNKLVGTYHPKAMPVILTTRDEIDTWLDAPTPVALQLQRPLPDNALVIVARGSKQDGGETATPIDSLSSEIEAVTTGGLLL